MDHKPSSTHILQSKIWHRLKLYLCEAWQVYRLELDTGQISLQTAHNHMLANLGDDFMVFMFRGRQVLLPVLPPRVS